MAEPVEVTDQTFDDQVMKSEVPVLVDFWAPWCQPCRMVAPVVEELAGEYEGRVGFVKINVDQNPEVAMKLGIRSIPTLVIFKGGEEKSRVIGFKPKGQLKQQLDATL